VRFRAPLNRPTSLLTQDSRNRIFQSEIRNGIFIESGNGKKDGENG
jgi:hypothetical protein